ncbi:MAG TPA: ROK family transcriptional regulator [Firmicutes bacterium]|nr:ROK family transcriptional regulator [Bacillota bacterium]
MRKRSSQEMRSHNQALLINLIRERGPVSRADLVRLTSLSPTTVSTIVGRLIRQGLILEESSTARRGGAGRPAIKLRLNPKYGQVIGVDLGVSRIVVALADLQGQLLARVESPTPREAETGKTVSACVTTILMLIEKLPVGRLLGVGMGLPGLVDTASGVSLVSPNLGFRNVPFGELLHRALRVPVFLENVIHVTTLGEKWFGAGVDVDDMICLGVGSGIGAGVVVDGRLYRGPLDSAGEIGHSPIPQICAAEPLIPVGERCACGRTGCLETVSSGPAIARAAARAAASGKSQVLAGRLAEQGSRFSAADVTWAAEAGDPIARQILSEAGTYLGLAVATLVNVFGIGTVVAGGGVFGAGRWIWEPMVRAARAHVFSVAPETLQIRPRALGSDASLVGAVSLALQHLVFEFPEQEVVASCVRSTTDNY